eukprot:TRINITY_DN35979_c0_g1_i1.p1 TRINITY_DN35979_c0_g1~~TRINITY_DN35979_c0_g1_i1.p1  ORF type:complete len:263 (+),score=21.45 TRINITY_DN35979_c0_g1_i1:90-878(+)
MQTPGAQSVMPFERDPNAGIANTTGVALLPGQATSRTKRHGLNDLLLVSPGLPGMLHAATLPAPPQSAAGEVIISVPTKRDPARPGTFKYAPVVEDNMGILLQVNGNWLNQAILTDLLGELEAVLAKEHVPVVIQHWCRKWSVLLWGVVLLLVWLSTEFHWLSEMGLVSEPVEIGMVVVSLALLCLTIKMDGRAAQAQFFQHCNKLQAVLHRFAEEWSRRYELQGLFRLTFRCGLTSLPYFELSPTAPPVTPAQALQLHPCV